MVIIINETVLFNGWRELPLLAFFFLIYSSDWRPQKVVSSGLDKDQMQYRKREIKITDLQR